YAPRTPTPFPTRRSSDLDSDVDAALARLTLDNNLDRAAESAELVIEAVPEKMELKLDVFSRLDQACANQAVLACLIESAEDVKRSEEHTSELHSRFDLVC